MKPKIKKQIQEYWIERAKTAQAIQKVDLSVGKQLADSMDRVAAKLSKLSRAKRGARPCRTLRTQHSENSDNIKKK